MILVDEGKVKLDDPIEKYLPEFRGQMYVAEKTAGQQILRSPSRRITLRDTLCHTSGMPFKSALEVPTLDAWPLDLRLRSYSDDSSGEPAGSPLSIQQRRDQYGGESD